MDPEHFGDAIQTLAHMAKQVSALLEKLSSQTSTVRIDPLNEIFFKQGDGLISGLNAGISNDASSKKRKVDVTEARALDIAELEKQANLPEFASLKEKDEVISKQQNKIKASRLYRQRSKEYQAEKARQTKKRKECGALMQINAADAL